MRWSNEVAPPSGTGSCDDCASGHFFAKRGHPLNRILKHHERAFVTWDGPVTGDTCARNGLRSKCRRHCSVQCRLCTLIQGNPLVPAVGCGYCPRVLILWPLAVQSTSAIPSLLGEGTALMKCFFPRTSANSCVAVESLCSSSSFFPT